MREDTPLYLLVAIYTLFSLVLLAAAGVPELAAHGDYVSNRILPFVLIMPLAALIYDALRVVIRFNHRRSLALKRSFSAARIAHLVSGMALLVAILFFQGSFTSIKNALPVFHGGFPFDRLHADIDAWLHLGADPWRSLHAIAANDAARKFIEWNYNALWFVLCFGALFFVATSPRANQVRLRYVVCFMLVWAVCGNLLAGLFLSAGPAFYGAVTGDHLRFGEQLAFLASGNPQTTVAANFQHYLWSLHEAGASGFGSGISAFPSVHVALATMNAFFLGEYSRRLGLAAFAYVALIVASSVYLAWHYAIDGYASIVIVSVIYFAMRSPVWKRRPEPVLVAAE